MCEIKMTEKRGFLMSNDRKTLTTATGTPVGDNQNSITAGQRGAVLIQDSYLLQKLADCDREEAPARIDDAKGADADGYFEVTNAMPRHTEAAFLHEVGKRTPVFTRFSTVAGEKGS